MKFYLRNIVEKARKLKKKGLSAAKIGKQFGVGDNTILRWCIDIPSNNPIHLQYQRWRNKIKKKGISSVNNFNLNPEIARILTSILYWCEGYRYPSCNYIGFSNSDISLVKTFLRLFRIGFRPDERKFRVHLQLHTTHDKKKMTFFWSRILQIPESQFHKPTITTPTKRMKRTNYKGTCTIKYFNFSIFHEIIGIYEGLSRKILKNQKGGVA